VVLHDCGTREKHYLPPLDKLSPAEQEYVKFADANDMVMLFPRLKAETKPDNDVERGCWDVFG